MLKCPRGHYGSMQTEFYYFGIDPTADKRHVLSQKPKHLGPVSIQKVDILHTHTHKNYFTRNHKILL